MRNDMHVCTYGCVTSFMRSCLVVIKLSVCYPILNDLEESSDCFRIVI
jgi:hypothetical protein